MMSRNSNPMNIHVHSHIIQKIYLINNHSRWILNDVTRITNLPISSVSHLFQTLP